MPPMMKGANYSGEPVDLLRAIGLFFSYPNSVWVLIGVLLVTLLAMLAMLGVLLDLE